MEDILYTSDGTEVRNVYRDNGRLAVRRRAVFPDICIGCGRPARGNVLHLEFSDFFDRWFLLPFGLSLLGTIFGKRYHFDFPFCASCPPDRLQIGRVRLDTKFAVFSEHINGFPSTLMDSLPPIPPDVAEEMSRHRLKRTTR